ncbi:MAG: NAD-dependent epimerase/dehydratase family protein [Acidobacteriota bacterium]
MRPYANRRTLVIGGLGFIGTNLVSRLVRAGATTTIVTPLRERHEAQALAHEADGVSIVEADIRDGHAMHAAVGGQDVVFNLSGQSGAVRSMEDPWTDLDVNCRGNLVLLEALRAVNPTAKLVFVGSRLQYGRPERLPVSEEDAADPLCLHAVHKSAVEGYLAVYRRLYGLRYTVARVTNPYGPGQPHGRTAYGVVNRMIHLALDGGTLSVYGDGSQLRDYVFIDDLTRALALLGSSEVTDGRVYNVGSGHGTTLVDLARTVIALTGSGRIEHVEWPSLAAQIETGDFVADISRIDREVGWRPEVALGDGLERTITRSRARGGS